MLPFDHNRLKLVNAFVASADVGASTRLLTALLGAGFARVRAFSRLGELSNVMKKVSPDFLIICDDLGPGILELICDIRNFRLGWNPFTVISVVQRHNNEGRTNRVVACGPDDLVYDHVTPEMLLERIYVCISSRRPFIATHDYIGPERRTRQDFRASQTPQIPVVNTLRDKLIGLTKTTEQIQWDVADCKRRLNAARLAANKARLLRDSTELLRSYADNSVSSDTHKGLTDVLATLKDAARLAITLEQKALWTEYFDAAREISGLAANFHKPSAQSLQALESLAR